MAPLFADNDAAEARLRLGACQLSDIRWRHHPNRRAEQTFLEVVHMPTLPESHGDRIFIGLSVFSRYTHKKVPAVLEPYLAPARRGWTNNAMTNISPQSTARQSEFGGAIMTLWASRQNKPMTETQHNSRCRRGILPPANNF